MRREILEQSAAQLAIPFLAIVVADAPRVERVDRAHLTNLAELPVGDEGERAAHQRVVHQAVTDAELASRTLGRIDHPGAVLLAGRHRLFDVHVRAALHRHHGEVGVRERRRQDVHDVGAREPEHLVHRGEHVVHAVRLGLGGGALAVDVGDAHDLDVLEAAEPLEMEIRDRSGTDEGSAERCRRRVHGHAAEE